MTEHIKTNDAVYFTANFYHPVSGYSINSDITPRWYVYESGAALLAINGAMNSRATIVGSYWGNLVASVANGFVSNRMYDVQVSGAVGGVSGFASVKSFVLDDVFDANLVQVSGQYISPMDTVDANIVSVSGVSVGLLTSVDANVISVSGIPVSVDESTDVNVVSVSGVPVDIHSFHTDLTGVNTDIYFAQVRHVSDLTNNSDEFAVHWFKNDQPVSSGALTSPRISVYNTNTGTALFTGTSMSYASPNLGVVRYNKTPMVLASGEPYLVEVSGVIDGAARSWRSIVGIDLL